jgi:hypothetical protein
MTILRTPTCGAWEGEGSIGWVLCGVVSERGEYGRVVGEVRLRRARQWSVISVLDGVLDEDVLEGRAPLV